MTNCCPVSAGDEENRHDQTASGRVGQEDQEGDSVSGQDAGQVAQIGAMVIEHLAKENKVAYLRFVSVYRRLKTVASFEKELVSIKNKHGV